MDAYDLANSTPREVRAACRAGLLTGPTAGAAMGFAQANLVVLAAADADDFATFCGANPKPCPLLEITEPGNPEPRILAPGADLRTDLPRYCVYERGSCIATPTDLIDLWRDDFVAFLIGCSFTFDAALIAAGVPVRHIEERKNVPMYRTNIACAPAGVFHGPLVVSMRPMTPPQADLAAQVTAAMPHVHGAPVHRGDPAVLGIGDVARPDYGAAVNIHPDEIPVFWACGVTPMEAIIRAHLHIAITHAPGHMFVTDRLDRDLAQRSQVASPKRQSDA